MTDIDAVAALPGGAELAGLAREVQGDPAAIREIARRWRTAGGHTVERLNALGTALSRVDAAWKGDSADAFVGYMRRYGRAGDALSGALASCADSLDAAAQAVETARRNVHGACDDLLAWVAEYRRRNHGVPEKDLEPGISQQAGAYTTLARGYAGTAETALTTARTDIARWLKEATPTFADIPPAADQEFVPRDGRATGWVPVPKREYDGYFGRGTYAQSGGDGGGGFGGYGPSGPPPPGGGPAPQGQVADWIQQAIEILKAQGYPVEKMNPNDIWLIIRHESGGNPHAINNWDSNAAAGHPSKGLMQTIDPTFDRWSLPGHRDIYDPVDNIIAGVRYAIERYGSVSNVPGVVGTKNGTGYRGY
ncbi:transglycosylase [Sphaerisporangium melleum]|uniref:Transglycosylase n=1 Tax=Sphaerisporangium melleum TaxID=321316 RepID=A0A917RMM3_9ACTN|nr:transglycosylase SLT domain-containing protein [Sphaerisporangium melleum]GGL14857.1 transglycosylase [Sphaerisporangium melleum]GII69138.1 transglycosylase [Sphaerisporangium melleum]